MRKEAFFFVLGTSYKGDHQRIRLLKSLTSAPKVYNEYNKHNTFATGLFLIKYGLN